jgi:hypothetical protein
VSREKYFFEGPKKQTCSFYMGADGFQDLWQSFCEKHPTYVFLLASTKSLTNCENPSSNNPLQKACSGFPIAACDSKSCSVSRL